MRTVQQPLIGEPRGAAVGRFNAIVFGSLVALAACAPDAGAPDSVSVQRMDLSGRWDGDPADWGTVMLEAAPEGYAGSYSSVFTPERGLGRIQLGVDRGGGVVGVWRDSDEVHHGTLQVVALDADTARVTWQARDARAPLAAESLWRRDARER